MIKRVEKFILVAWIVLVMRTLDVVLIDLLAAFGESRSEPGTLLWQWFAVFVVAVVTWLVARFVETWRSLDRLPVAEGETLDRLAELWGFKRQVETDVDLRARVAGHIRRKVL